MAKPTHFTVAADDDPDLRELLEQRRAKREKENAYIASVFSDYSLQDAVARAHGSVHVEGGPCVQTAPEDAEFVPGYALDREREIAYDQRVTCPDCRTAMAITGGDTASETPDEYAKQTVLTHAQTPYGNLCLEVNKHSHVSVIVVDAEVQTPGSVFLAVNCPACWRILRERGYNT